MKALISMQLVHTKVTYACISKFTTTHIVQDYTYMH